MSLPQENIAETQVSESQMLGMSHRSYLGILSRAEPFTLEIAAESSQLFQEMDANWPVIKGWEKEAEEIRAEIKEIADAFITPGRESHLRLTVHVGTEPKPTMPVAGRPAACAAFDSTMGVKLYRAVEAQEVKNAPIIHDIMADMIVLYQPYEGESDARIVAFGLDRPQNNNSDSVSNGI